MVHDFYFILFFGFLGLCPQHVEVPRLGVESELQLLACTTATATQDPNHIGDLCRTLQQCQICNPMSEARDGAHVLTDTSQVHYR